MLAALATPAPLGPAQAIVLGVVQGLTELLPVSSSAHLYIVPTLFGWKYEGLAFDVALHGGTLIALVVAFWKDWLRLLSDALGGLPSVSRAARRTWAQLVVATIPGAIAGKLLDDMAETHLRALPIQATTLFVFGGLLWLVDRSVRVAEDRDHPTWLQSLSMGFAQCLALVPGVSRSGITMTAGRATGLSRVSAARFSFLLATPITLGALILKLPDLGHDVPVATLLLAVASAAISGVLAIRFLLHLLRHTGFGAFFAYRAALAGFLVLWIVSGHGR